jgi:hypothetical protein
MEMKWNASLVASGDAFRIEAEPAKGSIIIRSIGLINEDVNFGTVLEFIETLSIKPEFVFFDMGGITRINSCGVREWLLFLQRVQSRYRCGFTKANEAFADVAGSIPTVFGSPGLPVGEIEAPFFCSKCNKRFLSSLKPALIFKAGNLELPPQSCPQCATVMEFDGLEEEYFSFLKHVSS